ncbi:MAG: hypothetical protein HY735_15195 [Verrucomicrobia bacterium]|nr:hypothetical protein [Verrucomicrobiota bacterium]
MKSDLPIPRHQLRLNSSWFILFLLSGFFGSWGIRADLWSTVAHMPTPRSRAAAGVINGKLYVAGGTGIGNVNTGVLEVYDPTTDIWSARQPMPTALTHLGGAVLNGKLYVLGGHTGSSHANTVFVYDPTSDTWTSKAPMPVGLSSVKAAVINDKIYLEGEESGGTYHFLIYNSATDTWTQKLTVPRSPPTNFGIVASVGAIDGKFYAAGGQVSGQVTGLDVLRVYDPVADAWTLKAPMPSARTQGGGAVVNGRFYVIGGFQPGAVGGGDRASVFEYDPGSDSWLTKTSMPTWRGESAVGVIGGKIYVAGGANASEVVADTLVYTPDFGDSPAPNQAPAGTDGAVTTLEDSVHTFSAGDFGFTDPDDSPSHDFLAVKITTLPPAGSLSVNGVSVNAGEVVSLNSIDLGGFVFAPASDGNGSPYTSFTFQVQDDGGTANGGVDLDPSPNTITINVGAVNDAPSFASGGTVTVNEDSGAYSAAWASNISSGPANEADQTVHFTIDSNSNPALFSVPPAVAPNGTLTFTPAANANGSATVAVTIHDNGGTANGGADAGNTANLTITVNAVNDAPSFTVGAPGSGKVTTPIGSADDAAHSVALQTDGKIVVAGYSNNGGAPDFALARYHVDGSLDTSFGPGGKVTTNFGASDEARSVAIQSDGKIVAAGHSSSGVSDFALARYNSDGSLDESFGAGGKVTTDFNAGEDFGRSVAIQSDGKIVVAGVAGGSFALARYRSDGGLDTTFGTSGKVTADFGTSSSEGNSVAIQGDGKIVVAGFSVGANYDYALARYNSDGSLDTSFGTGGKVITAVGSSHDEAFSIAVQLDGKILVAGYSFNNAHADFALVRYNLDGSLDTSFGTGGKVATAIGSDDDAGFSVGLQADGRIVVAGYSRSASYDFALVRYNNGGNLDTSFGAGGKVTTAIGAGEDIGKGVATQANGRIVVAGRSHTGSNLDFALVRYNSDGSLDIGLGGTGSTVTVAEDSGPYVQAAFTQNLSSGPPNESGQTITFNVSNDNNGLFSVQPAIDANGTLTFTPAPNQNGSAIVTVALSDDGGTANGGANTSTGPTFSINVTAVNDAPVLTTIGNKSVDEEMPLTFTVSATDADVPAQSLTFSLGAGAPIGASITPNGNFSWTPSESQGGQTHSFTVIVTDNGTNPPNLSDGETFTVTVNEVNLAPVSSIDSIMDDVGRVISESDSVFVGQTISLTGSFTDHDQPDSHTAAIDWGDGVSSSLGVVAPGQPITGDHIYTTQGDYQVKFIVTDIGNLSATAERVIRVVDAATGVSDVAADLANLLNGGPLNASAGPVRKSQRSSSASLNQPSPKPKPAAAKAIQAAIDELIGQNGGAAKNGAIDLLAKGDLNAALVKIRQAIQHLETAKAADPSLDLAISERLLALAAASIATQAVAAAEAVASTPKDRENISNAKLLIDSGRSLIRAGAFLDAIDKFRSALILIKASSVKKAELAESRLRLEIRIEGSGTETSSIRVKVFGTAGVTVALERSENLRDWDRIDHLTIPYIGVTEFRVGMDGLRGSGFYRVKPSQMESE